MFNYYSSVVSEAKYKSIHGEWIRISTPKQILTIALAQVKTGNTYENLLNVFRQKKSEDINKKYPTS